METLASGLADTGTLAVGDAHAYVTEPDAGLIERVALDGGARQVIVTGRRPMGVALDQGFLYWTDFVAGTVERMPRGGGPVQVVARDESHPSHVTLDDTFVYWTTRGVGENDGTVMRACKDGRFPQYLALDENRPSIIRVEDGIAFWIDYEGRDWGFYSMRNVFTVMRSTGTPSHPGEAKALAEALSGDALAVDSSAVFFADNGGIQFVSLGGGTPHQFSWSYPDGGIALDACNVYSAASDGSNGVFRTRIVKRWKASPRTPAN